MTMPRAAHLVTANSMRIGAARRWFIMSETLTIGSLCSGY